MMCLRISVEDFWTAHELGACHSSEHVRNYVLMPWFYNFFFLNIIYLPIPGTWYMELFSFSHNLTWLPASSPAPHSHSLTLPLSHGVRQKQFNRESKSHAYKQSKTINSLPPTGRQVFSHSQETRGPSHVMVTWVDKCHHFKCPPLPPPYPTLHTDPNVTWSAVSLCSFGVTCPGCVTSQPPRHPQLPPQPGSMKSRRGLGSVQSLLINNKNISVLSTLCSAQPKTQPHTSHCENWLYPSQTQHTSSSCSLACWTNNWLKFCTCLSPFIREAQSSLQTLIKNKIAWTSSKHWAVIS